VSEYEKKLAKQARVAKALEKQEYAPHTARMMAEAGATASQREPKPKKKKKTAYAVVMGRLVKV
jgi:hypothetical protein